MSSNKPNFTEQERLDLLDKWNQLKNDGENAKSAAHKLNVSVGSLYAWNQKYSGEEPTNIPKINIPKIKKPQLFNIQIPDSPEDRVSVVLVNGSAEHVKSVMGSIASIIGRNP